MRLQGAVEGFFIGQSGQENNRYRSFGPQVLYRLDTIPVALDADVAQQQIDPVLLVETQGFAAVIGRADHAVAFFFQQIAQVHGQNGFVFHNKDVNLMVGHSGLG